MIGAPSEPASRRRFGEVVAGPAIDLAEAAFLIACEEYPDLDLTEQRRRLEELGRQARARLDPRAPLRARAGQLAGFLGDELGFRGNAESYYDPRNSFLNDVLARRLGIPITLSALYIEVGRRAGLPLSGVGLPGHFIVRVDVGPGALPRSGVSPRGPSDGTHSRREPPDDTDEDILLDPFHSGRMLSLADCQRRLDRIFDRRVSLEPDMLMPCGARQILTRMLYNLKGIYVQAQDHWRALGVVELLLLLEPGDAEELRDRGLLYAALDCYGLAVLDLEAYLSRAGKAPEASGLRETLENLRARQARVN